MLEHSIKMQKLSQAKAGCKVQLSRLHRNSKNGVPWNHLKICKDKFSKF